MNILRLPKVIELTGLSRASIYRYINTESFPRPINIGPRSVGWIKMEVEAWINERIAKRDRLE